MRFNVEFRNSKKSQKNNIPRRERLQDYPGCLNRYQLENASWNNITVHS
jgi:hypothetical protein